MATNITTTELFGVSIDDICEAHDVEYLGLFGSYARGDNRPDSDVDLLVRFRNPVDYFELVETERALAERLDKKVDLVTFAALSPYIKERVLAQMKAVYERT